MFLFLVITTVVVVYLHHFLTKWEHYLLGFKLEGPIYFPFVGNIFQVVFKSHEGLFNLLLDWGSSSRFKSPTRVWLGPKLYILVTDPEHVKTVLNAPECLDRDKVYKYIEPLMGKGLVTLPGHSWKEHRRFLNPTFNVKILKSFLPIFNRETNTLVSILENEEESRTFDIYKYMDRCTLDTVCQTTMGTEMHIQKHQNTDYLDAANNLLAITTFRMVNPLWHIDRIFQLTKSYLLEIKSSNITFGFVDKILTEKKRNYTPQLTADNDESDANFSYKAPQVFIDQLLKLSQEGKYFTDSDVKNESNTIVATGFESSALISSYCILSLAMNPAIQEKVHKEIIAIAPNRNEDVDYDSLQKFEYLERVLKETMRLYPTVPTIARYASEPFQLGDLQVPKDTHIMIGIMCMHRDENIWGPTVLDFNPDRFLPENMNDIHTYAYVPFSAGPRNCIGIKYAMMFLKIIMIKLIRDFEFTTPLKFSDMRHSVHVSLKLENKHLVKIRKRHQ